jgi:hypothetical protein
VEANSTGGQDSRRAVAPSDDDDDDYNRIFNRGHDGSTKNNKRV